MRIVIDGTAPQWAHDLARDVELALAASAPPKFSATRLPSAAKEGQIIFVPDEIGGAVLAFSDGTNWLRSTDRAVCAFA